MTFNDKEYARTVWTEDKIQILEREWTKQQEGWYNLLHPLIPSGETTLDVGCGVGMYYDLLSSKTENYLGIDPSEAMVERAGKRRLEGKFKVGTVYGISYIDSF